MNKGLILMILTALISQSCKKDKNTIVTNASLYNTWESLQNETPRGLTKITLKINANDTFEENLISLGIYEGQALTDTSGWIKSQGQVIADSEKIRLISHEYRLFDKGPDNVPRGPFVNRDTFSLYANSKFKIVGNTLDFYYTSADTTGYIKRTFFRKK